MNILEALSQEDKIQIENWISTWAVHDEGVQVKHEYRSSVDHVLCHWAHEKQHLFDAFGEKLILEEKVCFKDSSSNLSRILATEFCTYGSAVDRFKRNYLSFIENSTILSVITNRYMLMDLIDADILVKNVYPYSSFSISNGSEILKIENGCKPIKILGKIAKMYGIEGFEEFRLRHSQIMNSAKVTGTLCISIHPLDYMTMSHNESGWTSCMSWEDGCHRQGTVEMMNSPNVVVAYLKGSKDMRMPGGGTWNNKKWRELFIVDNDIITEIKPYPYYHDELTETVLNTLKKIMGEENYDSNMRTHSGSIEEEDIIPRISFDCYYMYNDFGATDNGHKYFINKELLTEKDGGKEYYSISYSGISECVWCGGYIDEGDGYEEEYESVVVCHGCFEGVYCNECGRYTYAPHYFNNDINLEIPYCPYCWEEHTSYDPVDGERYHNDNFETLYIVPDRINAGDTILHDWYPYYWIINTVHIDDLHEYGMVNEGAEIFKVELENKHWAYWSEDERYSYSTVNAIRISDLTNKALNEMLYDSNNAVQRTNNLFNEYFDAEKISTVRGDILLEEKRKAKEVADARKTEFDLKTIEPFKNIIKDSFIKAFTN